MGYDPNRSPSVVDNLSLGIRSMGVEDETALSQQGSTYRNGNHASAGVPNTLPHVQTTPLQPRGPYTTFPVPEYGAYYPGTPTGQSSSCCDTGILVDLFSEHAMYTPSPVTPSAMPASVYPAVGLFLLLF